jgi:hypothetical protein
LGRSVKRKAILAAAVAAGAILSCLDFAKAEEQVITDPAGYISASSQYQPIPYSRQNLTVALQRGGGQVFEIGGDVSNLKNWSQGWRSYVSLDLTTTSGEVVQLRIPSELKSVAAGDFVRVLARLSSTTKDYAYLEVIAISTELDLIASSVSLKDRSQVGTIGWVNGYNPGLENYGEPYLPLPEQATSAIKTSAGTDSKVESYKNLISSFNPNLTSAEQDTLSRALLTYATAYGVQPSLAVALFACESGFNPKAVSRTGAQGLGQLMPGTAAGLGVASSFDPVQNIEASLRLLRGHLIRFAGLDYGQQLSLALACYNAGSGAVEKYEGVPPYSETRNYIRKVSNLFSQLYQQGYR